MYFNRCARLVSRSYLIIFSLLSAVVFSAHNFSEGPIYARWMTEVEGQPNSFEYNGAPLVHKMFPSLCALRKVDSDSCNRFMDTISYHVSEAFYTPTRSTSTLEDYTAVHQDIVLYALSLFDRPSYLEIGCSKDANFALVRRLGLSDAICVDPVEGGTHRMTSDDFFIQNKQMFDVIFVDGLHTGQQAYIDVLNSLLFLKPNGIIVMHDCNARSEIIQGPQGKFPFWSGDVWRAAVALRLHEGIDMIVGDFDYGVGVVRRKHNSQKLPVDWIIRLAADPIAALKYSEFAENREILIKLRTFQEVKSWMSDKQ